MKAGRKGEGGRSKKLEQNMMHGNKLETGGKGQHERQVNVVEEDGMMGGCRRRQRKEGHLLLLVSRPEERDEHVLIYRKGRGEPSDRAPITVKLNVRSMNQIESNLVSLV